MPSPIDQDGNDGWGGGDGFGGLPVRYTDVVKTFNRFDLGGGVAAPVWGHARGWTNGPGYAAGGENGNGWVVG